MPTPTPPAPTATPLVDVFAADAFLAQETAAGRFSGVALLAQDGRILLEKGYGLADREAGVPNTVQTRFHIGSVTKQFTAMAILQLQERGKLRVTDNISQYLPDCPAAWRDITIEHLLTHTSGLPDYFDQPGVDALLTQAVAPGEIVRLIRDQPLLARPGAGYRYCNSGYVLLGEIVERASGESYASWIQDHILAPLEMAHTTYGSSGPATSCAVGYESAWVRAPDPDLSLGYAAGGLCSTVEDLYRWDQALYTRQICGQGSLDAMFSAHVRVVGDLGYGYGWFVRDGAAAKRVSHTGLFYGYSAVIVRYPGVRVTIILLSNLEDAPLGAYADVLAGRIR